MAASEDHAFSNRSIGYFCGEDAIDKAEEYIYNYELKTLSRFVKVKSRDFKKPESSCFGGRLYWEEKSSDRLPLEYDGMPFIITGMQVRECVSGPDRHLSEKRKLTEKHQGEHGYTVQEKKRRLLQPTKKVDCPAAIHLRYVVKFPTFKLETGTEWAKKKRCKELKEALKDENVPVEHRVYVSFPANSDHRGHLTEEFGLISQSLDKDIISHIHMLVHEGVRNVAEMKRHLTIYSKQQHPGVPEISNRFYPSNKDIRNHMYRAMQLTQFSTEDQDNLLQFVNKWKAECPNDNFYFTPSPQIKSTESETEIKASEDFLFVYQAHWQKRLLSCYGNEICLLDATYKTSKYDLPLFFLCVATNVGYSPVATFLIPDEKTESISRGLAVLKKWNSDWNPKYFMTDFDWKEITAIETTFPGCFTYLCDFHRLQAWDRWLRSGIHGCGNAREDILSLLKCVANAESELEYNGALADLKKSEHWRGSEQLRLWFEKQWIPQSKRWVRCYRQSLVNIRVTTTNGLERQHHELKRSYLSGYTEGTLTTLVTLLVTRFFPDSYKRYVEYNVKSMDLCRRYSTNVPRFLHNRPRMFLEHCIQRLPPVQQEIPLGNIVTEDNKIFKVTSVDSGKLYTVNLASILPSCSCGDWKKNHLPCKHQLAILTRYHGFGWDSLSAEYRQCPHFIIDPDILNSCRFDRDTGPPILPQAPEQSSKERVPVAKKTRTVSQHQNVTAIGSRCKMLSASINSLLYLVQKKEDFEEVYKDLASLHTKLRGMVPAVCGIPIRPPKFGRKDRHFKHGLLKARKKRSRVKKGTVMKKRPGVESRTGGPVPNKVIPMDSEISITEDVTDVEHDVTDLLTGQTDSRNSFRLTAETVLQQLLNTPPTDRPIVQIGPYTITDSSMHYLNSTLSDEVIDSCLHLMVTGNVCHIDCANMTAIFDGNGSQDSTSYLPKLQLQRYDALLGAVNEGGDHWVLMIIIPGAKRLVYMNPLGELSTKVKAYEHRWCMFLTERCQRGIEKETMGPHGWCVETVPHSKQLDSSSCGIYVIKFAEHYLSGKQENVSLTSRDLVMERRRIQLELLSRGIQEQEMLALPVRQTNEGDLESVGHKESGQPEETCRKRKMKDETEEPMKKKKKNKDTYRTSHDKDSTVVSMVEVEKYLLEEVLEEKSDKNDDMHKGELAETRNKDTPVYTRNAAVSYFIDMKEEEGKLFKKVNTGWGEFVLLPEEDFDEFIQVRSNLEIEKLAIVNPPLLYFLGSYNEDVEVDVLSKNVVELDLKVINEYQRWCLEIKEKLSLDLN